jgi:hypothetical protein
MTASLTFQRFGGSYQMRITTFAELEAAVRAPEALWVATACPTQGLACDARFLALLDGDGNGRVRAEELRAAVAWTAGVLAERGGVEAGSDVLTLAHLAPAAARLAEAAGLLLETLGADDRTRLSLAQLRESEPALRAAGINGDGLLAPEQLPPGPLADVARLVLGTSPGRANAAGLAGVDAEALAAFRLRRAEALAWAAERPAALAWGPDTLARARRLKGVQGRLEEYFLQCRLVASQPDVAGHLRVRGERVEGALGDAGALALVADALPVAPPRASGALAWGELFHGPAFEALTAFRDEVVLPALGPLPALSEADFRALRATADAALAWEARGADPVFALGEARLSQVAEADLAALEALSRRDRERKPLLDAVAELERLLLNQRWLLVFANNFVAMPHLYDVRRSALFERGRLVLSGRDFRLAVLVPDRAAHAALAEKSHMCLAYVRVQQRDGVGAHEVVVPVTSGTSAGVEVGRRGVFYDTEGKEYDATVLQVVRQPVSLWEAATLPFRRAADFLTARFEELGGSGSRAVDAGVGAGWKATTAAATVPAPAAGAAPAVAPALAPAAPAGAAPGPAAPAAAVPGALGGLIAAGGVALAAVGSATAFMLNQLRTLTPLDVLRALLAIAVLVMAPSAFLGWLKLRRRNLGVVLEGSGWALNDKLLLTRRMGLLFTRRPRRPEGARVDRVDALASMLGADRLFEDADLDSEARARRRWVALGLVLALLAAAVAWREPLGRAVQWLLPGHPGQQGQQGAAPAAPPAP